MLQSTQQSTATQSTQSRRGRPRKEKNTQQSTVGNEGVASRTRSQRVREEDAEAEPSTKRRKSNKKTKFAKECDQAEAIMYPGRVRAPRDE